jgi:hypothetical protein
MKGVPTVAVQQALGDDTSPPHTRSDMVATCHLVGSHGPP